MYVCVCASIIWGVMCVHLCMLARVWRFPVHIRTSHSSSLSYTTEQIQFQPPTFRPATRCSHATRIYSLVRRGTQRDAAEWAYKCECLFGECVGLWCAFWSTIISSINSAVICVACALFAAQVCPSAPVFARWDLNGDTNIPKSSKSINS